MENVPSMAFIEASYYYCYRGFCNILHNKFNVSIDLILLLIHSFNFIYPYLLSDN